ncbi:putative membrane-anchored protein [Ochrobactrum sp. P20RRXII]|nr:heme biosynthesis protein HemY [Ochrobactrum sp. P20RRXII]NIH77414.1 putative membrane-anchored protein [Ochrobactrum sp. P20RRXII]
MSLLDKMALFFAEANYFLMIATKGYQLEGIFIVAAILIVALALIVGLVWLVFDVFWSLFKHISAKLFKNRSETDTEAQGSDPNAS